MKTFSIALLVICTFSRLLAQQNSNWKSTISLSESITGYCISSNQNNEVLVSGSIKGHYRIQRPNDRGCFLRCYTANGMLLWNRYFFNPYREIKPLHAIDSRGHIYFASEGIVKLNSNGSTILTFPDHRLHKFVGLAADPDDNLIVAARRIADSITAPLSSTPELLCKFSPEGKLIWSRPIFPELSPMIPGFDLCVDKEGSTIITGVDTNLISVVKKFDKNGTQLWSVYLESFRECMPRAVTALKNKEIIVSGTYEDTRIAGYNVPKPVKDEDIFLIKISSSGKIQWIKTGGGKFMREFVRDLCTDEEDNIILTGGMSSPYSDTISKIISFDGWTHDRHCSGAMIAKFSSDGDLTMLEVASKGSSRANAVCAKDGKLFITGEYHGGVDYRPEVVFAGFSLIGYQSTFVIGLEYDRYDQVALPELHDAPALFQVYPNPNSGQFSILYTLKLSCITISIYNSLGQCIQINEISSGNSILNYRLSSGVYVIELRSGSKQQTKKVIVR